MGAEMNLLLSHSAGRSKSLRQANERNGAGSKTVITDRSSVQLDIPRDRDDSFEPIPTPKHERRFTGFDERIIAMYVRGMSVGEIQGFLTEPDGTEVSPDFISSVTDEVMAAALRWQSRPLETMYPATFFDSRCKFFELHANHTSQIAGQALSFVTVLYDIEREAAAWNVTIGSGFANARPNRYATRSVNGW
ncbi:hypothetical protein LMG29660_07204 [Burkholderia puraquae]|uniref:Mutator family transposase n=1 Tax=Burkholderia puraquae TaxID=1904757 RepID=A0A6J5F2S5_9BURK|nr:hypothetical protein LMG29660_07204 [Burkholderia puraquae]